MNIYLFYCLLGITALELAVFAILARKSKDTVGIYLIRVVNITFIIILNYFLLLGCKDSLITDVCMSLIKIGIIWCLFFGVRFVEEYTQTKASKIKLNIMIGVLVLDSILFLTNIVNKMMMSTHCTFDGYNVYISISPQFFYPFHLALVIILGGYAMANLIMKAHKSSEMVRFRYSLLAHSSFLIYAFETWYVLGHTLPLDITIFLYPIAVFFGYFLAYSYVPRKLLKAIMEVVDNNSNDATFVYDEKGAILRTNKRAAKLFNEVSRSNLNVMQQLVADSVIGNDKIEIEDKIYSLKVHELTDRNGVIISTIYLLGDITENERSLQKQHKVAITDYLTGSLNRAGFFEEAKKALCTFETHDQFVLMIGGINEFKEINSIYGTKAGDGLLLEIVTHMDDFSKNVPMVYGRTAEGKFACLLEARNAHLIEESLKSYKLQVSDNVTLTAGMSFGMILIEDPARPLDYYYERALLALVEAKHDPQNNVVEYTQEMEEEIARKQLMTSSMHESLKNGDFFLVFQPQIDLKKNEVVGAEALLRWKHPSLGMISPGVFIPLFEGNGFITKLDIYVWEQAAIHAIKLKEEFGLDKTISVNVSRIDIEAVDVCEIFEDIVQKTGIDKSKLHIEITESACANNIDKLIDTIERLRNSGFKLEIDDFGSGYSSLNVLKDIPFDTIKLDMGFMDNAEKSARGEIILDSVVQMIHSMCCEVIVEGVETPENYQQVVALGADVGQGYLFSKPLSLEDYVSFAKNFSH